MKKAVLFSLAISVLWLIPARGQGSKFIGIVQEASPGWSLKGSADPLQPQQLLASGAVLSIGHSTNGRLVVALFSQSERWEKVCSPASPCEGDYGIRAPEQKDGFRGFLKEYWHSDSKIPAIFAGSRGVENEGPTHSLLVIHNGQVQMVAALLQVPPGDLKLNFLPQPPSSQSPTPLAVHWTGGSAEIPAPAPGLYCLDVYNSDGERIGNHAAVLLVREKDRASQAIWSETQSSIATMGDDRDSIGDDLRLATLFAIRDGKAQ